LSDETSKISPEIYAVFENYFMRGF